MKRIGLISDTHGHIEPSVFTYFAECDEIWHAGDFGSVEISDQLAAFKPLRGVYGNIDDHLVRAVHPLHNRFTIEGLDVWMTHIGGFPNHYNPEIRALLKQNPPNLFICGHSHILRVMRDPALKNMLCINPGAAGNHGFHKVKTIVRFTLDAKAAKDLEVIELGQRGLLPAT